METWIQLTSENISICFYTVKYFLLANTVFLGGGMSGGRDVWCVSCNTGYLKGEKVDCKKCCTTGVICETC